MTDPSQAGTGSPRSSNRPAPPLWLVAMLTLSGTLAMHIFVPALPIAGHDLGAAAPTMQLTISLYILGLAVGQLIYGPLSDRLGRRPALVIGLALYVAASIVAAFAADIRILLAARLLQALGGCAGLVLGRAIVRDTAAETDAARRLAVLNLIVTLGPGLAPLVGGALANSAGWRAIFLLLTALGVANVVLTLRLLPETGSPARDGGRDLVKHYRQLVRSPAFLGFAIGGGCATTSMYAFVAAAPFIFVHDLHRPVGEVGAYLSTLIVGVWVGSMLASRLIGRVGLRRLLITANGASVAAAFALLAAVLTGELSAPLAVALMFVFTIGVGTASPAALTQAISVNPRITGSASGLYGFAQMAIGALCTALVGLGPTPSLAAALVLAGACITAQIAFAVAARAQRGL